MKAAIFLDRDGTIIEDQHYPKDPHKVVLLPNAVEGLKLMREKGYLLFVVSNQSGVGRGIIKDEEFRQVHEKFCELLKNSNVEIDEFNYCLHHPDDHCLCRKPKTGLIATSFKEQQIDLSKSFAVGDKICDLELADNLGAKGCLVLSGKGKDSLAAIKDKIGYTQYQIFNDLLVMAQWLPNRN